MDPPAPERRFVFPDPASALPTEPRPFVGPDHLALVKMLQHRLARPCVAGVFGPAGSGKSALCEKLLNTLESRRAFLRDELGEPVHRRFWVELEGCGPGTQFEERFARAVGCASFAAAIARLSTGQPALVVLDNADDAWIGAGPDDPAWAQLAGCSRRGTRIVVTMRHAERTDEGLPLSARMDLPPLDDVTALGLFKELAPEGYPEAIGADLARRCDGSPLAVTLVARAAAGRDPTSLQTAATTDGPRGLPFALAACAGLLDADERRLWAALSLFPAGLDRDDIREVLEPLGRADQQVAQLYQMGLARRAATGVRVPRLLAWVEPDDPPAEAGVAQLWHRYTARALQVIAGGHPGDWLVAHQPNLAVLADQRPLPDRALDLACAGLLADRPAHVVDTTEMALVAIAVAAIGDGPVPARVVEVEAALRARYRAAACQTLLSLMLSAGRRTGDRQAETRALDALGTIAYRASRYEQADALLSEARQIAGDVDDPLSQADVLFDQGKVALSQGSHDQAELLLSEAQVIYDEAGSQAGQAGARLYRGELAAARSDDGTAEALLSEAQDLYDRIGNQLGRANARLYRGRLATTHDEHDTAAALISAAQDIYDELGDQLGRANARLSLGDLASRRGRRSQAESLFTDAQLIYDEIAHRLGQANARLYRGELVATRGGYDDAETLFRAAQQIYDEIGDRRGQANVRFDRGKVAELQGRADQAAGLLAEARQIYAALAAPAQSTVAESNPGHRRRPLRRAQRVRRARHR